MYNIISYNLYIYFLKIIFYSNNSYKLFVVLVDFRKIYGKSLEEDVTAKV